MLEKGFAGSQAAHRVGDALPTAQVFAFAVELTGAEGALFGVGWEREQWPASNRDPHVRERSQRGWRLYT